MTRLSPSPLLRPTRLFPLAAVGLAAALAACAQESAPSAELAGSPASAQAPNRSCFRPNDVNGWRAVDSRTVNVSVGANRVFQMSLMGSCPDINWSQHIGIESTGSSWICSGLDATIISPTRIGPRRCPVTGIHQLTPAEVAALPPRQRP